MEQIQVASLAYAVQQTVKSSQAKTGTDGDFIQLLKGRNQDARQDEPSKAEAAGQDNGLKKADSPGKANAKEKTDTGKETKTKADETKESQGKDQAEKPASQLTSEQLLELQSAMLQKGQAQELPTAAEGEEGTLVQAVGELVPAEASAVIPEGMGEAAAGIMEELSAQNAVAGQEALLAQAGLAASSAQAGLAEESQAEGNIQVMENLKAAAEQGGLQKTAEELSGAGKGASGQEKVPKEASGQEKVPGLEQSQDSGAMQEAAAKSQEATRGPAVAGRIRAEEEKNPSEQKTEDNQETWQGAGQAHSVNPRQETFASSRVQTQAPVPMRTSESHLAEDLGDTLASGFPQRNGTLTVELEPASLGKLTIHVAYEAGKAAVSIMATNPRTLEILNQRAGELASILRDRTGQETVVYTQEPQQQQFYEQPDQGGRGERQQGRDHQEEKQQGRQDAFAQQLRLGLV